jgi:protein CpxP
MSLKTRFFSLISAAVAVTAFATFSFAQDTKATTSTDGQKADRAWKHGDHAKGEGFGHRDGMHGMGMFRDLNLTDAQKTQIHSIMEANKPDQASMEEMKTLFKAKREGTLTADQQSRLTALREQSQVKMKAVHEQILAVLTPEQRAQLEAKKAEMNQKREQFRQERQQRREQKTTTTDTPKVN